MAELPGLALAMRVARDLRHRLQTLDESAARVRAQRLRSAVDRSGRLARAHATDAEAIHDLRVAARRLTAGLHLWRPALARGPRRRALRLLRRVRRSFGPLREIEVHVAELARRTHADSRRTPAALVRVASAWRERYALDRRVALERLTPDDVRSMRRFVDDALASLPERLRDSRVLARVRRRVADTRRAAREALSPATAEDESTEVFHAARIAVKKWRYAEECWHAAFGTEPRVVERLRAVQEALGQGHDGATLRAALADAVQSVQTRWLSQLLESLKTDERNALARFRGLVPPLLARPRNVPVGAIGRSAG